MKKIIPVIRFEKDGEKAAKHYTGIFPDSRLTEALYGPEGNLIGQSFEICGTAMQTLNGGMEVEKNPSISFTVNLPGKEEIDRVWQELSPGGNVLMPLEAYDFNKYYGWIQDRYGISWQLMYTEKPKPWATPALLFTKKHYKQAEKAIEKYTEVFDRSRIDTLYHYGDQQLIEDRDALMYGAFKLEDQPFSALDSGLDHRFTFNEGISLMVLVETQQEIDSLWQELSSDPDHERCGWLKDEFGVFWQIVPKVLPRYLGDEDKNRARRVMDRMLKMKKLVIGDLKKAYDNP